MLMLALVLALAAVPQESKPATNVQCPVMGGKVDSNSTVVTVQGRSYRLCCNECVDKLKGDPNHFLKRDGTFTGAWEDNTYTNHR